MIIYEKIDDNTFEDKKGGIIFLSDLKKTVERTKVILDRNEETQYMKDFLEGEQLMFERQIEEMEKINLESVKLERIR